MKKILVVLSFFVSLYWVYGWFTSPSEIASVRVRLNNETDDTAVRICAVAFERAGYANVPKGKQEIYDGMMVGDRTFVVYEPLNEAIIALGKHTLREEEKNIDIVVRGNKKKGYTLSFERSSNVAW